jgi:hypothetical protein
MNQNFIFHKLSFVYITFRKKNPLRHFSHSFLASFVFNSVQFFFDLGDQIFRCFGLVAIVVQFFFQHSNSRSAEAGEHLVSLRECECECQTCLQWSVQLGLEIKFQRSMLHLPVHRSVRFLGLPHEMGSTSGLYDYDIQVLPDVSGTSWFKTACHSFDRGKAIRENNARIVLDLIKSQAN